MKFLSLFLGSLLLATTPLKGDVLSADFDLSAGYRRDQMDTTINVYNAGGDKIASDKLDVPKIGIYQVGARARLSVIGFAAKAEIDYGVVQNGHYTETFGQRHHSQSKRHGKVSSGWTKDVNVAGGYLLFNNPLFKWGPMAGYSKNEQSLKFAKGRDSWDSDDKSKNFKFKAQWQGPWLGVDLECCLGECFKIWGGYEYHWANWKASRQVALHEEGNVSTKSNSSKNANGRVYYASANWIFCQCLSIGANFKLQQWTANHGKEKSRFGNLAPRMLRRIKDKVKQASWDSWAASLDIGFHF